MRMSFQRAKSAVNFLVELPGAEQRLGLGAGTERLSGHVHGMQVQHSQSMTFSHLQIVHWTKLSTIICHYAPVSQSHTDFLVSAYLLKVLRSLKMTLNTGICCSQVLKKKSSLSSNCVQKSQYLILLLVDKVAVCNLY